MKNEIYYWKDKTKTLHSFGLEKVRELNRLMSPNVEQLYTFKNALIKALGDEIDANIDNHKQILPELNSICEKANKFTKCLAEQEKLLSDKEELV